MQSFQRSVIPALAVLLASVSASCTGSGGGGLKSPPSAGQVAFQTTVKPLFEQRCVWCHGDSGAQAGLNLQNRTLTLDPAQRFIVPGDALRSRIYAAITQDAAHPKVMPGDGWGITENQRRAIKSWIDSGAPWPEGRTGRIKRKPYRVDRDDYL